MFYLVAIMWHLATLCRISSIYPPLALSKESISSRHLAMLTSSRWWLQVHPPSCWWLVIFRSCGALPAWFGDLDAMATWSKWPKDHLQLFGRSLDESSGVEDSSTRGKGWRLLNEGVMCWFAVLYIYIVIYVIIIDYICLYVPCIIWIFIYSSLFIYSSIHGLICIWVHDNASFILQNHGSADN